mmetsp:Transcript_46664/g.117390  ORF Transcript_46664/g.117390 Transcript_46664/m.117390 type:complete len:321 (-) Transcript_46664:28-990(-)
MTTGSKTHSATHKSLTLTPNSYGDQRSHPLTTTQPLLTSARIVLLFTLHLEFLHAGFPIQYVVAMPLPAPASGSRLSQVIPSQPRMAHIFIILLAEARVRQAVVPLDLLLVGLVLRPLIVLLCELVPAQPLAGLLHRLVVHALVPALDCLLGFLLLPLYALVEALLLVALVELFQLRLALAAVRIFQGIIRFGLLLFGLVLFSFHLCSTPPPGHKFVPARGRELRELHYCLHLRIARPRPILEGLLDVTVLVALDFFVALEPLVLVFSVLRAARLQLLGPRPAATITTRAQPLHRHCPHDHVLCGSHYHPKHAPPLTHAS